MLKRVFYYSGYRLTVFHWKNEVCVASYVFNPDEDGFARFKTYLRATQNTPVRILVDLIEEDFKKENIPHVGAIDRKSIVSRKIERQFRKSKDYVHYKIVGREQSARKDDILLYSVLSNPDILKPWLKPMRECNTAISGIWSLPLLSQELFSKIGIKAPNVLLISQQIPSNLRQTFLKNGHFESSRSAILNIDVTTIGDYIATEVEQTIRFLSNQRYIGFDEKIEVHVICRDADLADIKTHCTNSGLRSFHFHNVLQVANKLGCDTHTFDTSSEYNIEYSNGIFSYLCASKAISIGHYGSRSLFFKYYEQIASKSLYATSAAMLLVAIIMSLSYLSQSMVLDNETITLQQQTTGVNHDYEKNLAQLEHKLEKTEAMQSSVLLTEKIRKLRNISPQNFMADISRIFTRSGMYDTEISKISWQQYQENHIPVNVNSRTRQDIDYAKPAKIYQHAVIGGFIRVSQSSLKDSVTKINAIVDAFKNNKLVSEVRINRMPVDIRSKSSIENETNIKQQQDINSDRAKGQFEFEILMLGREQ